MKEFNISFVSKAKYVTQATPLILKENLSFRYTFVPLLVSNETDSTVSLHGEFIVQRKGKNDNWVDVEVLPINKMVKDTWIKLDMSSLSLDLLIEYCIALKTLAKQNGFKFSNNAEKKLLVFDKGIITDDIMSVLSNPDFKQSLKKYFQSSESIDTIVDLVSDANIFHLASKMHEDSAEKLYISLVSRFIDTDIFDTLLDNTSESFWQNFFVDNPHILSMVIPSLFQLIQAQPYLGGKNISKKGASIGDYIYRFGSKNTAIIEIKTPTSILMNSSPYRPSSGVFLPGNDLIGGIQQLHKQRDKYQKSFYQLSVDSGKDTLQSFDPQLFLIIGNTKMLDADQLESFELFRNQQKNLFILTYNEISDKLKLIKEALTY